MKIDLHSTDIIINNLCNRTCEGCVTYSNFSFTGHYQWTVSKPFLEQWNNIVNIANINIMGGEPLLHPNLLEWISGVKNTFGDTPTYRFFTGVGISLLEKNLDTLHEIIKLGYILDISIHDKSELEKIINLVETQLLRTSTFTKICQSTKDQMFQVDEPAPIDYLENNVVKVRITTSWMFMNNTVKEVKNNTIHFFKSDPQVAFDNCPIKTCMTLLDGKLYKCPSLVTLQNFSKQFSCEDQELIDSIDSISPFDGPEKIDRYINSLKYPVEQCKLCPETRSISMISNNVKKIKIVRKK